MENNDEDDPMLDILFSAGNAHRPTPDATFLEKLHDDASSVLAATPTYQASIPRSTFFARFNRFIAASGLSGAAALGVWIGFIMPDIVSTVSPLTEDVTTLSAFLPNSDLSVLSE